MYFLDRFVLFSFIVITLVATNVIKFMQTNVCMGFAKDLACSADKMKTSLVVARSDEAASLAYFAWIGSNSNIIGVKLLDIDYDAFSAVLALA